MGSFPLNHFPLVGSWKTITCYTDMDHNQWFWPIRDIIFSSSNCSSPQKFCFVLFLFLGGRGKFFFLHSIISAIQLSRGILYLLQDTCSTSGFRNIFNMATKITPCKLQLNYHLFTSDHKYKAGPWATLLLHDMSARQLVSHVLPIMTFYYLTTPSKSITDAHLYFNHNRIVAPRNDIYPITCYRQISCWTIGFKGCVIAPFQQVTF